MSEIVVLNNNHDDLSNKEYSSATELIMKTKSEYNVNTKQRILKKKDRNKSAWEREMKDSNRKSLAKKERFLIDKTSICEELENGDLLIHDLHGHFITLNNKLAHNMLEFLPERCIKIYVILKREHIYWTGRGEQYLFTLGGLCEEIGLYNNDKNRKNIQRHLNLLAQHGLIVYSIIPKDRTFYRRLEEINDHFVVFDIIDQKIEETIEDYENGKINIPDNEPILQIGFSSRKPSRKLSLEEVNPKINDPLGFIY